MGHLSSERYWLSFLFILSITVFAAGQDTVFPDEISTEDFSRSRDITKSGEIFSFKKYKLKHIQKPVKPRPARAQRPAEKAAKPFDLPWDSDTTEVWKRLGITIWRVPTGSADETPKRVSAETVFAKGDRIRLSFESPTAGYLYVFDREMYGDETVGDPLLVFPTKLTRMGNNRVEAGRVIDVPGQTDRPAFFEIDPKNEKYRGELMTVIISPEPLRDIVIPETISPFSALLLTSIENKYIRAIGEYEIPGTSGQAYSEAEKAAGRSLTRELTLKDPFPQTMFRVKMRAKEPMLVSFNLSMK